MYAFIKQKNTLILCEQKPFWYLIQLRDFAVIINANFFVLEKLNNLLPTTISYIHFFERRKFVKLKMFAQTLQDKISLLLKKDYAQSL